MFAPTNASEPHMPALYGNLNNRLMEGARQPAPQIGMGVTMTAYSDRHAGTIIAVAISRCETVLTVQEDIATRADANGMSDIQTYTYRPNPKTGRLITVPGGNGLLLGERNAYRDFGF